jgi:hypothetical protein
MILLCGHLARVHPTTNSPFRRLQVRIRGAHPNFRIARPPTQWGKSLWRDGAFRGLGDELI